MVPTNGHGRQASSPFKKTGGHLLDPRTEKVTRITLLARTERGLAMVGERARMFLERGSCPVRLTEAVVLAGAAA